LDNSIDGALRLRPNGNYEGLWVDIVLDVKNGIFTIKDNCGGIPVSIARDYAFRFGRPSFEAQHTQHSVGVFGIGMKRALFKLGKKFKVESVALDSSFTMEVDVDEWKGELEWQFHFSEFEEDLKKHYPEEKRYTKITVTDLNPDVNATFKIESDIASLLEELQREHIYSLDKGLLITVNGKRLKAPELTLLVSDRIKPAVWEGSNGSVKVTIIAGVSKAEKGI
jgi:DNA gyrase/topoisomerase IV subunit B